VAVSGGIDSVVMLHKLVSAGARPLVVAHVDHGIRPDSAADAEFVGGLAGTHDLEFVSTRLELGADASEDAARTARYAWLEEVRKKYQAEAIATAHHQDDVIETMIINLVRGTSWRGLCSLRETRERHRPLLGLSKAEIIDYALKNNLEWREDSTNESFRYLRNRIRSAVVPRLTTQQRRTLLGLYDSQLTLRGQVGTELSELRSLYMSEDGVNRYVLTMVEDVVAIELLRDWLGQSLEQARFRDLLLFAKTARAGAKWSLDSERYVLAKRRTLIVSSPRD
jgi:tRNA(Ile)-lysidine synthase